MSRNVDCVFVLFQSPGPPEADVQNMAGQLVAHFSGKSPDDFSAAKISIGTGKIEVPNDWEAVLAGLSEMFVRHNLTPNKYDIETRALSLHNEWSKWVQIGWACRK